MHEPEVLGCGKVLTKWHTVAAMYKLDYTLPQVATAGHFRLSN